MCNSNSSAEFPLMGKASFLFFVFGLCSVHSCDNFRYDYLVHFNGSAECPETDAMPREPEVTDVFNEFTRFVYRWESSLPENSECRMRIHDVHREATGLNFWALKMLDASAKMPSGILSGNLNQFGDFDECLSVKGYSKSQTIQGKYCLANIDIKFDKKPAIDEINKLDSAIHSNWILHSGSRDEGHRIPKFETFNVGICIPASCEAQEIESAFGEQLNKISKNSFVRFEVSVDDEVCYVEKENEFSPIKSIVWFIFALIAFLTIVATLTDTGRVKMENLHTKIMGCFSLKRNLKLLLKTSISEDDIKCIHGARFLNAVALLLSHKQIAMLFSPYLNRTQMSESFDKGWTMIGRTAILYTDSFILLSGLLISYSTVKQLDRRKTLNFKEKLTNRIVRLLPNLFGVIFFCTYIMNDLGSGPQWGLVVSKYAILCKKYMWRNFLFVHNYFGFENMCLTHTHQVGIDMQLFLASPLFIYVIWKLPKIGVLFLTVLSAVSTWLRYEATHREKLSTLLYYGISVERLWKTANNSYILPTHRLTVYLAGIMLGYYLRRGGGNLRFSFLEATIGWILATAAALVAVFGPYQAAFKDYVYDVNEAARFNAFAPILWTAFISWCIIACINGVGGIFNDFLSWKYFIIFTRLSYAVYLTQFPVFFYNVGTERTAQYYKGFHSLFNVEELIATFVASIVLTLTFDIPFQELKKALTSAPENINKANRAKAKQHVETIVLDNRTQSGRRRLQHFGT